MGLFSLPEKDDIVGNLNAAKQNIEIWKQNKGCDYLIDDFVLVMINRALECLQDKKLYSQKQIDKMLKQEYDNAVWNCNPNGDEF